MRTTALRSKIAVGVIALMMAASMIGVPRAAADEGMWTFDNPPLKQLKELYDLLQQRNGWIMCGCPACVSMMAVQGHGLARRGWCLLTIMSPGGSFKRSRLRKRITPATAFMPALDLKN